MPSFKCFIVSYILVLIFSFSNVEARQKELSTDFYYYSCPQVLDIVRDGVVEAIKNETRNGASLLRLHFHDCFVNVSTYSFSSNLCIYGKIIIG